jgi:hypothetical protein
MLLKMRQTDGQRKITGVYGQKLPPWDYPRSR